MFNKINIVKLHKFNNAEYANLMQSVADSILMATPEKLGIEFVDFENFKDLTNRMSDSIGISRVSSETAKIKEIDKKADKLIVLFFTTVRSYLNYPDVTLKNSSIALYQVIKNHEGCTKLAHRQQIEQMRSMLMDLDKGDIPMHLQNLNICHLVDSLREVTTNYEGLLKQRIQSGLSKPQESGISLRKKLDKIYKDFCERAYVTNASSPTQESLSFITTLNKIIDECNMAYTIRISKTKKEVQPLKESA